MDSDNSAATSASSHASRSQPRSENLEEQSDITAQNANTTSLDIIQRPVGFIEELSDSDSWASEPPSPIVTPAMEFSIDALFTSLPLLRDLLETETSYAQDKTLAEVIPFLSGEKHQADLFPSTNSYGVPPLLRAAHVAFLHKALQQLPAPYMAADAGRPWFFYWALCGLATLGEDVSVYRERLVSTVTACQHPDGGFGGGHGQMAHLAPSYAIILSLTLVGGQEAVNCIDREGMWKWLGRCKQEDGGFSLSVGGEVDVRGAFCAVVMISLLNLPVELPAEQKERFDDGTTLLTGLAEWVARCQTFEGGISSRPDAEAHGAYAFCALACLCVLGPPNEMIPKHLDVSLLISWMSARQYAPEGGFAGRTNKLVDGCYSHWIGGCWPIIEAVLKPTGSTETSDSNSLYSREGLIRYILCCCQETKKRGGLRDKPSKNSDAYHTCYVLAGLSAAQHSWTYLSQPPQTTTSPTTSTPPSTNTTTKDETPQLTAPFNFAPTTNPTYHDSTTGTQIFDETSRVQKLHPVFVVSEGRAEAMRAMCIELGPIAAAAAAVIV